VEWKQEVEVGGIALLLYSVGPVVWGIGGPVFTMLSVLTFLMATLMVFLVMEKFVRVFMEWRQGSREKERGALHEELLRLASTLTKLEREDSSALLHPDFRVLMSNIHLLISISQGGTSADFLSSYVHSVKVKVVSLQAMYAYD
jgi:hypothetical protein